jgi:hypothetical protein
VMKQLYWPSNDKSWGLGTMSHSSAKIWVKSTNSTKFFVRYSPVGIEGIVFVCLFVY